MIVLPMVEFDARKLYAPTWIYAISTPDKPFITSHTPVCFIKTDGTQTPFAIPLIDNPTVIVAVPLSATAALIRPHGNYQSAIAATEPMVRDINEAVLWQSRESIFTCQKEFLGDGELAD